MKHPLAAAAGALAAILAIDACASARKAEMESAPSSSSPSSAPAEATDEGRYDTPTAAAAPAPAPATAVEKPPVRIDYDDRLINPKGTEQDDGKGRAHEGKPSAHEVGRSPGDLGDFGDVHVVGGEARVDSIFQHYGTNPTIDTAEEPFSTFSVDVDTASYAMTRGMLNEGALPDPASVRVEEFVNSFRYDYPPPTASAGAPFSIVAEAFPSPNRKGYHVLLLGLRGRVVAEKDRPPANLVFVVDVSGSMDMGNRLELVKRALGVLVDKLREDDTVSIVTYGDVARVALAPASGAEKARIRDALARLHPEGSTNAQAGIMLGYETAQAGLAARPRRAGVVSRLIVCSDGVANNGVVDADGIFATVGAQAQRGVELSTVGFGMGNYNDVLMEKLAVKGQGRYAYVDRIEEAKKIFVENLGGELVNIAKDVKIQVELDKDAVERYRLIGFENRKLSRRDFGDDKVDAGEIGAGHEVTALYEVKLKAGADRIGWLRVRAKDPGSDASKLVENELTTRLVRKSARDASALSRLALVASSFAEKLRMSYWARNLSYDDVKTLWSSLPADLRARPDVSELGRLIDKARALDRRGDKYEGEQPVATMDFDELPVLKREN